MSNSIDFLLVISKIQSPIYCPYPQLLVEWREHAMFLESNLNFLARSLSFVLKPSTCPRNRFYVRTSVYVCVCARVRSYVSLSPLIRRVFLLLLPL